MKKNLLSRLIEADLPLSGFKAAQLPLAARLYTIDTARTLGLHFTASERAELVAWGKAVGDFAATVSCSFIGEDRRINLCRDHSLYITYNNGGESEVWANVYGFALDQIQTANGRPLDLLTDRFLRHLTAVDNPNGEGDSLRCVCDRPSSRAK